MAALQTPPPARPAPFRGIGSEIIRAISRLWLAAFGWRMVGDWPLDVDRAVMVAAPHTSNWDGLHMVAAAGYHRRKLWWMGKQSLGKGIGGVIARRAGLVAVDRSGGNDLVASAAAAIKETPGMVIAVAPEGTRSYTAEWKSGFYYIARAAQVPILMAVLDYGAKTITVAGPVTVTDDMDADLAQVKAAYRGARGKVDGLWEPVGEAPKH